MIKAFLGKATADGEQIGFDIYTYNPVTGERLEDSLENDIKTCLGLIDTRVFERNIVLLEHNDILNMLNAEERLKFVSIFEHLFGRLKADAVRNRLAIMAEEAALKEERAFANGTEA